MTDREIKEQAERTWQQLCFMTGSRPTVIRVAIRANPMLSEVLSDAVSPPPIRAASVEMDFNGRALRVHR